MIRDHIAWDRAANLLLMTAVGCCIAAKVSAASVDEILRAWESRLKFTQSAVVEFDHEDLIRFSADGPMRGTLLPPVPIAQRGSVRFAGDRMDYRLETLTPDDRVPRSYRSAFDGKESRMFAVHSRGAPEGHVDRKPLAFDTNRLQIMPIILAYRPLHAGILPLDSKRFRLREQPAEIDGRTLRVLEEVADRPIRVEYWVHPNRGYLVERYISYVEGIKQIQQDITYREDATDGWVLDSWKSTDLTETGEFRGGGTGKVRSLSINVAIPDDDFKIRFPRGTRTFDHATNRDVALSEVPGDNPGYSYLVLGTLGLCAILGACKSFCVSPVGYVICTCVRAVGPRTGWRSG